MNKDIRVGILGGCTLLAAAAEARAVVRTGDGTVLCSDRKFLAETICSFWGTESDLQTEARLSCAAV